MDYLPRSEAAEETIYEFQRLGFSKLSESGKMKKIQNAEREIIPLMPHSESVLDICNQRIICRMAKKLGCQFCVTK